MDISVYGPGIWFSLHSLAAQAQTPDSVKAFKEYLYHLRDNFPCDKCKPHIKQFIDTHPFGNYTGERISGKDVGYFRFTWIMHSKVNERLRKPFFSFEKAYDIYMNGESCHADVCPGMVEEERVVEPYSRRGAKRARFNRMSLAT